MSWYISAQNVKRNSTEHFWISEKSMRELRSAAIHELDVIAERTCEGCKHESKDYSEEPCRYCKRLCDDWYEVVNE